MSHRSLTSSAIAVALTAAACAPRSIDDTMGPAVRDGRVSAALTIAPVPGQQNLLGDLTTLVATGPEVSTELLPCGTEAASALDGVVVDCSPANTTGTVLHVVSPTVRSGERRCGA